MLMRLGPIGEGQSGHGQLQWSIEGQSIGAIRFRLDLRDRENARLILYFYVNQPDDEPKPKKQTIMLTSTLQNFGGIRWWLRCDVTGERVRTLHLPPNGDRFASRRALGLAYRVERLSRFDQPFEKMFRVQRKLGAAQGLAADVKRPKGMWRRTFARHVVRLEQCDVACMEQIAALIGKA